MSPAPAAAEADLVARARARDAVAFAELARRARTQIFATCMSITGNHHDAEDALQEALTAAWQHIGAFDGRSRFSTWLHRIAANVSIDIVRRRRRVVPEDQSEWELPAPGSSIGDRVADGDAVQRALAGLPDDFREALVLFEIGGLSYRELAEHQQVPVQTIKSRLFRARSMMRRGLAGP
ncbi:hypothetical protein CSPHI_02010 [Corynebacterium sphenisci DSM 44792]|uniref:RNA polymerase sigma factor n=1 Tax=Corynebacterium sphenisci DSM 44792 TaxID=1437874 RepID=A0A1L7CW26_9CORY|nr:RNA polymerase sigma factor [Corynebacterium sphenisci]APT90053.1 hypothetical protein CSPHI_02010 [Corynebacterium sphenisci DSM 44792]